MGDLEKRVRMMEGTMQMYAAKIAVWEVAIATLLEQLAAATPDPKKSVSHYVELVRARVAEISRDRWPDDKEWAKAIDACAQNFEELLKFTFPAMPSGDQRH